MSNQPETNPAAEQPKELTEAEIKVLRARRMNYYNEQIKYLKPEKDYFEMLASIEEAKARQVQARFTQAQLFAAMNREDSAPAASEPATGKTTDHVVTQEDLDNNPELLNTNVQVGDTIQITE